METVNHVLLGAIVMGFAVIGIFFLRFWRDARDRFFLLFAFSFFVEAANRGVLALSDRPNEGSPAIYLVRLGAFVLILIAVLDKNGVFSRRP